MGHSGSRKDSQTCRTACPRRSWPWEPKELAAHPKVTQLDLPRVDEDVDGFTSGGRARSEGTGPPAGPKAGCPPYLGMIWCFSLRYARPRRTCRGPRVVSGTVLRARASGPRDSHHILGWEQSPTSLTLTKPPPVMWAMFSPCLRRGWTLRAETRPEVITVRASLLPWRSPLAPGGTLCCRSPLGLCSGFPG